MPQAKTAFVTGASSGLGLETAAQLVQAGFAVYAGARSFPEELSLHPRGFKTVRLDVSSEASVESALAAVRRDSATPLRLLVNNAGFGLAGAVEEVSAAEAEALFAVNFFGLLKVCRAALPEMREARSGLIVNVGSLAARVPLPFQGLYSASKAAVAALSEALAAEVRPFGVEVALLEPGDFSSGFSDGRKSSAAASPAYAEARERLLAGAAASEKAGMPASFAASRIVAIALSRRRRFRYVVGSPSERLGCLAKALLPKKRFDKLLESHYKR